MSNVQNTGRLNELITTSGIYEAISILEVNLEKYMKSDQVNSHLYIISHERLIIERLLKQLKNQLADFADHSLEWEKYI